MPSSSEREPRRLNWFTANEQFAGRYVQLPNGETLKLHVLAFPDGDYTYLAAPSDPNQLRVFVKHLIETELGGELA